MKEIIHDAWLYTVRIYRGDYLLLETRHRTKPSKDLEVDVARQRMHKTVSKIDKRIDVTRVVVISHVAPYGEEEFYS